MKKYIQKITAIFLGLLITQLTFAQINRTLETKAADILAQFPTEDATYCNRLMQEIIDLGSAGITQFSDMIIPPGTGDDTQARFAIESLARYAGEPGRSEAKSVVQPSLLDALQKANDKEVKAFFIRRLQYCADETSIPALEEYLADKKLYSPAVSFLTSIGGDKAGQAILQNAKQSDGAIQMRLIKALGDLAYTPAEDWLLTTYNGSENADQILLALARIGGKASQKVIEAAAKTAGYQKGPEIDAYLVYAGKLGTNGNKDLSNKLCTLLLKKCTQAGQMHLRSAAVTILQKNKGAEAMPVLLSEIHNANKDYRNAILNIASEILDKNTIGLWIKEMNKVSNEAQSEIIHMLASQKNDAVLNEAILPGLKSESLSVRKEAIEALAINQKQKAVPALLEQLMTSSNAEEREAIKKSLLLSCSKDECKLLAAKMEEMPDAGKVILVDVVGAKRSTDDFQLIYKLCQSQDQTIQKAAFGALKNVASPKDVSDLLGLLKKTNSSFETEAVQDAIIWQYNLQQSASAALVLNELSNSSQKEKLIPVLPYLDDPNALNSIKSLLKDGTSGEKQAALTALINWGNASALPVLFDLLEQDKFPGSKAKIFDGYLDLVKQSGTPDDQKLLLIRKLTDLNLNDQELKKIISAAGNIKTFLSLVFVSEYLDNDELSGIAASSAMKIALPSPGAKDGLTGNFVSESLNKAKEKITGNDSQYFKIDIAEYLNKMPADAGYVAIFNGTDLDGWQGLVKNPIERAKMTEKELAKAQVEANRKMLENWSVKDGCIVFDGKGDNLCTKKKYGDFEMLVDWRINKDGDSGIYLRGTPQVQIWDTARVDVGAQVGSGGLYNNTAHESKPLVLADNAIGDWNTFYIKMVGEKVTVYLNGVLVVDNVTMENYWDRSQPIFPVEAIELQAHGNNLAFRNIYVREINSKKYELSDDEKAAGFYFLFDGSNLDKWVGNKVDYVVENGEIAVKPKEGNHGNLYSEKEYSDFILRFEFQLTPGANNGLGVHAPLDGDAAYVGKELQILDNTASIYENLAPYQYHGSVYGIIPAKRGFLKPVGEWNYEEVTVRGDNFKIILNGEVILDGNVKEASKNGTADHKDHPGLQRHTGHIGFLGHGSELKFRNIRIKELQ